LPQGLLKCSDFLTESELLRFAGVELGTEVVQESIAPCDEIQCPEGEQNTPPFLRIPKFLALILLFNCLFSLLVLLAKTSGKDASPGVDPDHHQHLTELSLGGDFGPSEMEESSDAGRGKSQSGVLFFFCVRKGREIS
jgi:hypothetical protein